MKTITAVIICTALIAFTVPAAAVLGLPETLEGTIDKISENTLVVISEKGASQQMVEIQINNETQFEETLVSWDNLHIGDKVKVRYKEEGTEKVALSIAKITGEEAQESPKTSIQL